MKSTGSCHRAFERALNALVEAALATRLNGHVASPIGDVELPDPETKTCRLCGRRDSPGVTSALPVLARR
jgi:hypothetical protein